MLNELYRFPIKLQFFAEGDGGNDGGNANDGAGQEPGTEGADNSNQPPKTYDEEYVKKLRSEAAKYRTKAKELEDQSNKQQQDLMKKIFDLFGLQPDPDKNFEKQLEDAKQKAQEAERKANDRLIRAEVKFLSAELGIIDADAAYALMAKENIKVNDDGTVEGVKEALEALVKAKPYLKGEQKRNVGTGTNPGGGNQPMSDEEWGKKMAEERSKRATSDNAFDPWK